MKIVGISQARMESSRLPGKVLMDLDGRPEVSWVHSRMSGASRLDEVVMAIPNTSENDELEAVLVDMGALVYRGSQLDVLKRYHGAATEYDADVVVRVTADCPFCDPDVIDQVVEALVSDPDLDYAANNLRRTYPLGLDCEAFTFEALETAAAKASAPHEHEHVTPFMYQHPDRFMLRNLEAPEWATRPGYRVTIDELDDLEMARRVLSALDGEALRTRELIAYLDAHPEVAAINSGVKNKGVRRPDRW